MARTAKRNVEQDSKIKKSLAEDMRSAAQLRLRFKDKRKKEPRVRSPPRRRRRYHQLSLLERRALVQARFGKLESSGESLNSFRSISRSFDVPIATVSRVINDFKSNDDQIVMIGKGKPRQETPPDVVR